MRKEPNIDPLLELIGYKYDTKTVGQRLGHLIAYERFLMTEFYGRHSAETIEYRDVLLRTIAKDQARIINTLSSTFFEKVRAEGHKDLYSFLAAHGHVYHYDPAYGKPPV